MAYIGAPPLNRVLSSADIAQGAVTLDDINFTDQPVNMDITGTIDKHTMRLADGVTITGDVTISDDLVLSKISDDGNAITMTNDGSSRTITGSGSIEASTLSQTPNQSLTGMTGTVGSAVTGGAGLLPTGVTSLGTVTTGTFNATMGDSWATSDKYYLQGKLVDSVYVMPSNSTEMINTTGSTNPYFGYTGDTTNIVGVNNHDIKLVKAGVYFISFSAFFRYGLSNVARYVGGWIRGSGSTSESTTELAGGYDQIANSGGSTDYGGCSCTLVRKFSANDLINFYVVGENTTDLWRDTHMTIYLIRPL